MADQKNSPFKDKNEFEKELTSFANRFRTTIAEHSTRINSYFEMSCFNMIVRYYELQGYTASVENLISGRFRFKCSPTGLLENFSYMRVTKDEKCYRIYHNASIQSAHDNDVYTTPDIVVSEDIEPTITTDYYKTKKRFSYFPNDRMVTFCEAKHLVPFPELMLSFIGTVNELKPSCLSLDEQENESEMHIAPSLMMSGTHSKPTDKIANSLQKRYLVNLLSDLFVDPYITVFSLLEVNNLASLSSKRVSLIPQRFSY